MKIWKQNVCYLLEQLTRNRIEIQKNLCRKKKNSTGIMLIKQTAIAYLDVKMSENST